MKWGLWSQTAASNSNTPPDGWPEGQAPSTVNDCAREMMAQIAIGLQDLQFIDLGLSPTQTGNTTFTVPGNQAALLHYGRRIKALDGSNTIYGTIISASQTTNTGVTLRLDTGNGPFLDASLSAFAVGFPGQLNCGVPENVYRQKNYLNNGNFDIWQRGTTFSFSAGVGAVTADRWGLNHTIASAGPTTAVTRGERSAGASNVPTLAQVGVFLNNSLVISCNAAVAGLSATDLVAFSQNVEGFNYREIAGKPMTLSFWVNSGVSGTYCACLRNSGVNRSVVLEFAISSVSTWEKKTLTFPKAPAAGTWDYSTGVGLRVAFVLAAGSNLQGGAGNWTAGNILATSNQTNFLANANKAIAFAGIKLEEGNQATPLVPTDYQQELAKCQRYLTVPQGRALGIASGAGTAFIDYPLPVQMRIAASVSITTALTNMNILTAAGGFVSISAVAILTSSAYRPTVTVATVGATGLTSGQGLYFQGSAGVSGVILFKSEL